MSIGEWKSLILRVLSGLICQPRKQLQRAGDSFITYQDGLTKERCQMRVIVE